MITVFSRVYQSKFTTETNYYFNLQVQGKPKLEVVYESLSDYNYYYSKYIIMLNFHPVNKNRIEVDTLKYASALLNETRSKRRLSVLTKFIFYLVMRNNKVAITRAINRVVYNNNGQEFVLSNNAFLKSYYKLLPFFNKVLNNSPDKV